MDRYLRVTHPSATAGLPRPCDLHVLSMPPAFALSQDQTLRFISPPSLRREDSSTNKDLALSLITGSPKTSLSASPRELGAVLSTHKRIHKQHPKPSQSRTRANQIQKNPAKPNPKPTKPVPASQQRTHGAPPTYPFHIIYKCQRTSRSDRENRAGPAGVGAGSTHPVRPCQRRDAIFPPRPRGRSGPRATHAPALVRHAAHGGPRGRFQGVAVRSGARRHIL